MNKKIPVELPPGYLDFFKNLESWENEQQIQLSVKYEFEKIDIEFLLNKYNQPILISKPLKINTEDYKKILLELVTFLNEERPFTKESIDSILAVIDNLDYSKIISSILTNDESYLVYLAENLQISHELLIFILDHSLRPFLRLFALPYTEFFAEDEFQSWDNPNTCPICGAHPQISRLRKLDGRRFMFCDRCFTEWEARYLECMYCGNNEPGSLTYISVENNDAYQIYVCNKCKGYLKTFDERVEGISVDMFITNMETIYLDLLAQEKGYRSSLFDETAN